MRWWWWLIIILLFSHSIHKLVEGDEERWQKTDVGKVDSPSLIHNMNLHIFINKFDHKKIGNIILPSSHLPPSLIKYTKLDHLIFFQRYHVWKGGEMRWSPHQNMMNEMVTCEMKLMIEMKSWEMNNDFYLQLNNPILSQMNENRRW